MSQLQDPNDPLQRKALLDQMPDAVPASPVAMATNSPGWNGTAGPDGSAPPGMPNLPGGLDAKAGNAGIAPGEGDPNAGPPPPIIGPGNDQSPPLVDVPKPINNTLSNGQDFSRLSGYDEGKFNDPNKKDFKYDTARVLSQFDPRQGITSEVLAALNKLGYGTFSGSGDKLSLKGATGSPGAADFANQDWIKALHANSGETKWNYGGGGAAGGGGGEVSNGVVPGAAGDIPNPDVQNFLNQGVPTDNSFFENLLKQAQAAAGPASTDRKALLTLMKQ